MKCPLQRNGQGGGFLSPCVHLLVIQLPSPRTGWAREDTDNGRDQQRDEPDQEREDQFRPGILQARRQIVEPRELNQRLIDPAQTVVILEELGDISLGNETEPYQNQS